MSVPAGLQKVDSHEHARRRGRQSSLHDHPVRFNPRESQRQNETRYAKRKFLSRRFFFFQNWIIDRNETKYSIELSR